jgi:predicted dehydrogenase
MNMDNNTEKIYHWGIIGLGKIARKFADDLRLLPNARLHAVASTSAERAQAFADEYGCAHAFGSYEDISTCPIWTWYISLHRMYYITKTR